MKVQTSELIDAALDWAVAKCEGYTDYCGQTDKILPPRKEYGWVDLCGLNYSTDWAQGGPIIEREKIGVYQYRGAWAAHCPLPNGGLHACMEGQPTPLIAAMRCYVASKLGGTVDIPDELNP